MCFRRPHMIAGVKLLSDERETPARYHIAVEASYTVQMKDYHGATDNAKIIRMLFRTVVYAVVAGVQLSDRLGDVVKEKLYSGIDEAMESGRPRCCVLAPAGVRGPTPFYTHLASRPCSARGRYGSRSSALPRILQAILVDCCVHKQRNEFDRLDGPVALPGKSARYSLRGTSSARCPNRPRRGSRVFLNVGAPPLRPDSLARDLRTHQTADRPDS